MSDDRIDVDHSLAGANLNRPGLELALAACRSGDTFVVTKLDRLARSLPDARDNLVKLTAKSVRLSLGGLIHDRSDPVGRLLFNVVAMVAKFEADLIRSRTQEAMQLARAQEALAPEAAEADPANHANHLLDPSDIGTYSTAGVPELFGLAALRSTEPRYSSALSRPTRARPPRTHTEAPKGGR